MLRRVPNRHYADDVFRFPSDQNQIQRRLTAREMGPPFALNVAPARLAVGLEPLSAPDFFVSPDLFGKAGQNFGSPADRILCDHSADNSNEQSIVPLPYKSSTLWR